MKILKAASIALVAALMSLTSTGCATYRTLSAAEYGSPKIYSGTRLNINAIRHDDIAMSKFKVDPPRYPFIDLPFSIVSDTLIFPLTFFAAAYESLFGRFQ